MNAIPIVLLSMAAWNADPAPQSQNVLLDFTATWCGPCQQMSPIVSKLQRQGYPIRKVDIEKERALAKQYNVSAIPAFVLVRNGKEVTRVVGMTSEGQLRRMLSQLKPPETPPTTGSHTVRENASPRTSGSGNQPKPSDVRLVNSRGSGIKLPFFGGGSREKKIDDPFLSVPRSNPASDSPASGSNLDSVTATASRPDTSVGRIALPVDSAGTCVRIRIGDQEGFSFGSGVIIDSRQGKAIVLTCAHTFRQLKKGTPIEVDLFDGTQIERVQGQLIDQDTEADVALLAVRTTRPVAIARVAPAEEAAQRGEPLYSIGCGGGKNPSRMQHQVTALNRYRGPENIECTGVPMQGRSGGGLYNSKGHVVGICLAADPADQRGLFAGLTPIHRMLDKAELSTLYRGTSSNIALAQNTSPIGENTSRQPSRNRLDELPYRIDESQLASMRTPTTPATSNEARPAASNTLPGRSSRQPVANDIADRRKAAEALLESLTEAGDADVVCIIRSKSDPQGTPRVVVIPRASRRFVTYLQGETTSGPVAASAARPNVTSAVPAQNRTSQGQDARPFPGSR